MTDTHGRMRLALMQPYLFPYIGYFQLIQACDAFVGHDDIQFIKGGWINRNRILVNGAAHLFTLSLKKQSSLASINERTFADVFDDEKKRLLRLLANAYARAPHFDTTYALIAQILANREPNVSRFLMGSLQQICGYLGIDRGWFVSSDLSKDNSLRAHRRVIEIVRVMGANHYINPIGGTELYSKQAFEADGIRLNFLKTDPIEYRQFGGPFVPNLSIIDVLMFHSPQDARLLLDRFSLV
jgi:hypothetical protein